jgi:hypothetical protein
MVSARPQRKSPVFQSVHMEIYMKRSLAIAVLGGNLDGDADRLLLGEQPAAPEGQLCAVEDG